MKRIQTYWYRNRLHPLLLPLLPLSTVFGWATRLRRWSYQSGLQKRRRFSLPVIIVGNISVGGTGKTPLVIALANYLKTAGRNPGIALRGVGGQNQSQPLLVDAKANPFVVGDEAVLIAQSTHCPVVACVDRPAAVAALQAAGCDLVLCDDGLQHYRLQRSLEIAVVDGKRYFGNGRLLPAGPLREPLARLQEVDFVVVNEPEKPTAGLLNLAKPTFEMQLKMTGFHALHHHTAPVLLSHFQGKKVHAVAGLGHPQRFFDRLASLGIDCIPHSFPDHYPYQSSDLDFSDTLPIVMTEKDAVKCQKLSFTEASKARQWFLRVEAEMSLHFKHALLNRIHGESL